MHYKKRYLSPIGILLLGSDGKYLTDLQFEDAVSLDEEVFDGIERDLAIFQETEKWLDQYFKGKDPGQIPMYRLENMSSFRESVIEEMVKIPFGQTMTYNEIAKNIAKKQGISRMSAQAVGGAVGWNPICILIPCHRVIGSNHNLTGYSGGIKHKIELLEMEGNDMSQFLLPKERKRSHNGKAKM